MKHSLLGLVGLFLILSSCTPQKKQPKVLLISFDGFRADYLSKAETPNFDYWVETGVISEGLIPVYPSNTFPNHYSIATGLYPENSGLIDNSIYDTEMDERYTMGNRDAVEDAKWYDGEPIWNTMEKQGISAGTMFWVGSEAPVQDMRPTHWKRYDGDVPDSARIDTVVNWLSTDSDFATLYFSFVDGTGHWYGPDSPEVDSAVIRADNLMGYLFETLTEAELADDVNIIIVSDHGMQEVSMERVVYLDDFADMSDIQWVTGSMLRGEEAVVERVYADLKANETHFKVYKKEEIPERYHLKNHETRVHDLLLVSELGYVLTTRDWQEGRDPISGGSHGFDNLYPEMWAIFVANGPAFKSGLKMGPFQNVHVYELINEIMGTEPAPNDGSLDSVKVMLN